MRQESKRYKICLNSSTFQVPVDNLPIRIEVISVERFYPLVGFALGLFFAVASISEYGAVSQPWSRLGCGFMFLAGVGCIVWSVGQLGGGWTFTISSDSVIILRRRWGRLVEDVQPLNAYDGIHVAGGLVSHGVHSNAHVFTVVLSHAEKWKSVPLYRSRSREEADAQARECSLQLGVELLTSGKRTSDAEA